MKYFILFFIYFTLTAQNSENKEMVKISGKNFLMDITEVTAEQFEKCVKDNKCDKKNYKTFEENNLCNYNKNKNHPMNCITWYGADEFCKWAEKRLPFDDEWQYSARGGENFNHSGSNNTKEVAWFAENAKKKTHEVKLKKANKYGLYDMNGNVWEYSATSHKLSEMRYSMNGGGFNNDKTMVEIISQIKVIPEHLTANVGFRCVKDEIIEKLPETLTKEEIFKSIKAIQTNLKSCALKYKTNEKLTVDFIINKDGSVSDAVVKGQSKDISKCVEKEIKGLKFGEFNGDSIPIKIPLIISQ